MGSLSTLADGFVAGLFAMTMLPAGAALIAVVLPMAGVPAVNGPETLCRVTDDRLVEISGLVAEGDGYVVVNDGADKESGRKIFYLNRRCKVTRTMPYPSRPRDTEDLARGADGTLWIADIGDNDRERDTIGLWRLAPGAGSPVLFRLSYPDGAHDAEALLVAGDGTPIVITKDPLTAGVYVPEKQLDPAAPVPLRRAGDFRIPVTTTENPYGFKGRFVVTGAATSPDGRRIALRTYADAFEFEVGTAGTADAVVRAIDAGSPRRIALPDEPQGESIAYPADGTGLLSISERTGSADSVDLLRYPLGPVPATGGTGSPTPAAAAERTSRPGVTGQPVAEGTPGRGLPVGALVAGIGLAVAALLLGLVVARRRAR